MKLTDLLNFNIGSVQRNLPNNGGTYSAPVVGAPKPGEWGSVDYVDPKIGIKSLYGDNGMGADYAYPQDKPVVKPPVKSGSGGGKVFTGGQTPAPEVAPAPSPDGLDYSKYMNPATGKPFTPQEYADQLASRMGNGSVPNYAGDTLTDPNKSAAELTTIGRNLNNERNDIATGAKDPYNIGANSGIQYTPTQLSAVEKAYAGIFDPALNDVFTKLDEKIKDDKQKEADRQAALKAKNDLLEWHAKQVFTTDENIRQWRATTGTRSTSSDDPERFTKTQLNKGASNIGLPLDAFNKLDGELKNFFINLPTEKDPDSGKSYTQKMLLENILAQVSSGDYSPDEASAEIESMNVAPEVKHYYIQQMPLPPEKKEGWFSKVWNAITN